jgi:phosphate-selective porin OprO/OprP
MRKRVAGIMLAGTLFLAPAAALSGAPAPEESRNTVGSYIYWDEGILLTGPGQKFSLKIGGRIHYGLRLAFLGQWKEVFEFKTEIDLDDLGDIKDNWIRFLKGPVLPYLTFGHLKEPFSLDMLTGGNTTTMMEFSLPTRAFGPFRNIGVTGHGTFREERMTWAAGFFINTGSFTDIGQASDRISEANGFNLTGRLTWLPVHDEEERRLVHLGLSYSHRFRDADFGEPDIELRTRPESRLTDDRLVETGLFSGDDGDIISLEAAMARGPFSLQGEYFHFFQDVGETIEFNGWYLLGSWVVTGEGRGYNTSGGVFSGAISMTVSSKGVKSATSTPGSTGT